MQEDRLRILEMLVEGKLTIEEAAYLLEVISVDTPKQPGPHNLYPCPAEDAGTAQNIKPLEATVNNCE